MGLAKPNQKLQRDLKEVSALLRRSGVDLVQMAMRMSEAGLEAEAQERIKACQWRRDGRRELQ